MKSKPLGKGVDDSKKRKRPSDARVARGGEAKAKKQPATAKEKRLAIKEMAESRKKKRMWNYSLEKVAVGGKDNVLEGITDRIHIFHNAIASGAARPKTEDIEHAFEIENFHSIRLIRSIILDCPAFAATLWKKALEGKCEIWA